MITRITRDKRDCGILFNCISVIFLDSLISRDLILICVIDKMFIIRLILIKKNNFNAQLISNKEEFNEMVAKLK